MSFGRRLPSIKMKLDSSADMLKHFSSCYDEVRTPARALKALGFLHHPSARFLSYYRDPMHWKIVYHCDPETIYQPGRNFQDFPPPPQPPQPPPPALQGPVAGPSESDAVGARGSGSGQAQASSDALMELPSRSSSSGSAVVACCLS